MSGTNFFNNFPTVPYRFGDNELPVTVQNLSVYIDAFEKVREEHVFYQTYYIKNNQRPEQLSYAIYGTTEYYWTLFLNNEHLRVNGWPLNNSELYPQAQKYYPNGVISTNGLSTDVSTVTRSICSSANFIIGATVWVPASSTIAKIIKIDDNLATIFLDAPLSVLPGTGEQIHVVSVEEAANYVIDPSNLPTIIETTTIQKSYDGWDAIHHYEDASGNWVYPSYSSLSPHTFDWSSVNTYQSVSYFQRLTEQNDRMRAISIIRPETVIEVVSEFNALLRQRL
jgi:hypothetical protein